MLYWNGTSGNLNRFFLILTGGRGNHKRESLITSSSSGCSFGLSEGHGVFYGMDFPPETRPDPAHFVRTTGDLV